MPIPQETVCEVRESTPNREFRRRLLEASCEAARRLFAEDHPPAKSVAPCLATVSLVSPVESRPDIP